MEPITLATPEQIKEISATSDLTNASSVFKYKDATAVLRLATELDPINFGTLSTRERLVFAWGLENILRMNGTQCYYFNVSADDTEWRKNIESFGAENTSLTPEIRYRKAL